MCYGRVFSSVVCLGINTYYTKKIIGYGFTQQMRDLMPILIHTLLMGAIVFAVVHLLPTLWLQLIVGTLAGVVYYLAGAYLMKFDELNELIRLLKRK